MASLAATAVTILRSWTEGSVTGKNRTCILATLTLTGQGGSTNLIPPTAFGLSVIEECSNGCNDAETIIYPAVAAPDGSAVYLADLTQATDANRALPTDISATVTITVKGY